MPPARDTIFALSSGKPPAAIAVVRISGPRARVALETLAGRVPEPRYAALARLRHPQSGEPIDEALTLWFPSPGSETGEDMAELQLHGGRAVIAAVLAALGRLQGFRPAEAGEFTRRAFENGRLDLTAVEGLADLIGAETEAQRRQAYRQLKGLLGEKAETWRDRIIEALALVEASIDFSDEDDVPPDVARPALTIARELRDEIAAALTGADRGERLRDGMVVAIAGPPNAGKSTLLNRLARREAAIVSPYAGTTRDVIEVHLDLGGYPVTLLDTAGVRESDDPLEREGVRRARERAAEADLILWVVSADQPMADVAVGQSVADSSAASLGSPAPLSPHRRGSLAEAPVWTVRNKMDLVSSETGSSANGQLSKITLNPRPLTDPNPGGRLRSTGYRGQSMDQPPGGNCYALKNEYQFGNEDIFISISALEGSNIDGLLNRLENYAQEFFGAESQLLTRARHRHCLIEAKNALDRIDADSRPELMAEDLRLAARALGRLVGTVDVEEILDVIFRDFCVGK